MNQQITGAAGDAKVATAVDSTILEDRVIWRPDLEKKLNVTSSTFRRWMLNGNVPPPDVDITRVTKGWLLSTLHKAGIRVT